MAQPVVARFARASVGLKVEADYGVAEVLDTTNIIEVRNAAWRPNQALWRDERSSGLLGINLPDVPGVRWATITWEMVLRGAGVVYSATVKPECDAVLRALGFAAAGTFGAGVEKWDYTPQAGGIMGESATVALFAENAPQGKLLGAYGAGRMMHRLGEPTILACALTGIYVNPGDVALVTANPSLVQPPVFKQAAVTRNNAGGPVTHDVASIDVELGNTVQVIQSSNDAQGIRGVLIANHRYGGRFDPEAVTVAVYDWHGELRTAAQRAWSWQTGTVQYNRVKCLGSRMQVLDVSDTQRNGLRCFEVPFKFNTTVGGDEMTIRFD